MCLSAVLLAALAIGGGSSPIPLRVLTDQSDAVVVAEISGGASRSGRIPVTLTIVRVLKGTLKPGQVLTADSVLGADAATHMRMPVRDFGLCFLARPGGAVWRFRPPISGYLLDFTSTYIPLPRRAKSVRLPPGIPATTMDKVIAEAASGLERADMRGRTNLVDDYRKNPSPALKEMFRRLCSNPNPRLRSLALRAEGPVASPSAHE